MQAQTSAFASGTQLSPSVLSAAHARLLADHRLRFSFRPPPAAPDLPTIPAWVGHLIGWVFVAGLALGLLVLLWLILKEMIGANWRAIFQRRRKEAKPEWRPEPAHARTLLADADRLAAEGAYADAVRLILHRSIEDIGGRRPELVRPALTAREIGAFDELPAAARGAFAAIAAVVERSFFGGRPVDEAGYAACRQAYTAFALPRAWA